jgi:hypothetical protein
LTGGLDGGVSAAGSDEFVRFSLLRLNPKALFDFCFVRFFGVVGLGGPVETVVVSGAADDEEF